MVETDPSDDFFINELEQQNNIIDFNLESTYQNVLKDLNLAFKYDKEKKYDEAYPIFKQHADAGNAEAQLKVGIYLRNRYVNSIDTLHSVKYLKKAALQNLPEAQYLYGTAIINRLAFGEKIEKGLNYLKMAALQNHILAMEDFGNYLKEGKFIEKDILQGEEFIKKATQLKELKL
jgi:TPR repeat protein